MGRMSGAVMAHPLSLVWQAIFTYASWAIALAMLGYGVYLWRRQHTPFYAFAVLAAGVAAFAEPLYDVTFDLWFYDAHKDGSPGAMWTHFTAFGVVQPNWTHSGYVILYSAVALYAGRKMYDGSLTRRGLFAVWGIEMAASIVFEMVGTGTNVYTYYGPYVLRLWHYPLVIGVLEGTQTVLFTVLATQIWRRVRTPWGLTALFVAFPMTMFGVNFGLGSPVIIALHLSASDFSRALVWVGTLLSIVLCPIAINGAHRFIAGEPMQTETDRLELTPQPTAA